MNDEAINENDFCFYENDYYSYYKEFLVGEYMNETEFKKMIAIGKMDQPKLIYINPVPILKAKLNKKIDSILINLKHNNIKASVIESLVEKYGTIAQIFCPKSTLQKHPYIKKDINWIDNETEYGFISRFPLSSLLPIIFLDAQPNDKILSCSIKHFKVMKILLNIVQDGYIFINDPDQKITEDNQVIEYPNCCVISYPITKIPMIEEFDKVLCIAPSTNDGTTNNENGKLMFNLDDAVDNHIEQKKYLISLLEKLKVGGICVYSTTSINAIENEAVVNSVLMMPQYKDKFEIVDCSSMFKDIQRSKGIKSWKLNEISKDLLTDDLLKSLSCDLVVENIDHCMRFYSHQIFSTGLFIAVIKKLDDIENEFTVPQVDTENKSHNKISIAQPEMIQEIQNDFGLPEEFMDIPFVLFQNLTTKKLMHVSQNILDVIIKFGLNKLVVRSIGSLAFTIINDNVYDVPFVPSIQTLPEIAKKAEKRFITIKPEVFDELIINRQIDFDKLSNKSQSYLEAIQNGGIYLKIEQIGSVIGAFVKKENRCIKVFEKHSALKRMQQIIKKAISNKFLDTQINSLTQITNEHEVEIKNLRMKMKNFEDSNLDQMKVIKTQIDDFMKEPKMEINQNKEDIENINENFPKEIESLQDQIESLNDQMEKKDLEIKSLNDQINSIQNSIGSFFSVEPSLEGEGILSMLKKREKSKFDRLFILSKSSNDYYCVIDPNNKKEINPILNINEYIEFELEKKVEICGIKIKSGILNYPKSFDIEIDDKMVSSIREANELNGSNKEMIIKIDPVRGHKIRLIQKDANWCENCKNKNNLNLMHFELLATDEKYSMGVFSTMIDQNINHDPHKVPIYISASYYDSNSFHLLSAGYNISSFNYDNSWFQVEFVRSFAILTGFRLKKAKTSKLRKYKIICTDNISNTIESWITLIEINEKTENENKDFDIYRFPNISPPVRYIRLVNIGKTWNGDNYLCFYHLDFFGKYL